MALYKSISTLHCTYKFWCTKYLSVSSHRLLFGLPGTYGTKCRQRNDTS